MQNQMEQQAGGPGEEMTSADQGCLFPPRNKEEPRDWVVGDPWDWPLYFYEHQEDVFTDVYTHEEGA